MSTILHLDASPRSASVSASLAAKFVAELKQKDPAAVVYHHNTTRESYPFVDEPALGVLYGGLEPATEKEKKILATSNQLIDELLAADVIVVGLPMWNLGLPASLKAWVDLISRPGKTFQYVAGGGVAPLVPAGKQVVIFHSSGGAYPAGSPYAPYNQVDPYLRTIFGFFGITDVKIIHIENQNRSGNAPAEGLAAAEAELEALVA
jgi:FMN-dependent NADH-azoreductase